MKYKIEKRWHKYRVNSKTNYSFLVQHVGMFCQKDSSDCQIYQIFRDTNISLVDTSIFSMDTILGGAQGPFSAWCCGVILSGTWWRSSYSGIGAFKCEVFCIAAGNVFHVVLRGPEGHSWWYLAQYFLVPGMLGTNWVSLMVLWRQCGAGSQTQGLWMPGICLSILSYHFGPN